MTTVNISLTDVQLNWMNDLTNKLGFASRSEFFRSIIRFLSKREELLEEVESFPFVQPGVKNKDEVLKDFKNSGKYSKEFLTDLKKGLARSDYFE